MSCFADLAVLDAAFVSRNYELYNLIRLNAWFRRRMSESVIPSGSISHFETANAFISFFLASARAANLNASG
jgi:hypothetical protein